MTAETTAPDPTAVMVRRIIAYYIDLAIYLAAVLVPVRLLAETMKVADNASPIFGVASPDRFGRIAGDGYYAFKGDTVYTLTSSDATTAGLIGLGVFLFLAVVLQGLTGRTIGKFVTGIRAVRPDGSRPGLIRAFIRELSWIIDGIPSLIVPIVGGVLALVTTGRRRIGDMLGRTYVVHRRYAGTAIAHPDTLSGGAAASAAAVAAVDDDASAMTDDQAVSDDRAASEAAWAADTEAGAPEGEEATSAAAALADADATPEPDEPTEPADAEPDAERAGEGGEGAGDLDSTPQTEGDKPTEPRWDPDRRAYITYDPRRGEWMQHDTESGEWGPISRA